MAGESNSSFSSSMPVIGAALDFGSQILGGLFSANQSKKNRQFQERMYHQQVEDNIKFWNMQNEYNLPSAVMQRMMDANINPYLAFEGGSSAFQSSQAPESATAPHGDSAQQNWRTNFGQGLQQAALLDAQIENLKADSEQKRAAAGEHSERTKGLNFENTLNMETKEVQKALMEKEFDLRSAMADKTREERRNIARSTERLEAEIRAIEQSIINEKQMTEAKINDINERLAGFKQELPHIIANLDSQSRKNYADAYVAQVTGNYLKGLYSEDYIKIMQGKAGQDLLNSIKFGTGQDIENALNAILYEATPKPGESMFDYNKFLKFGVSPLVEVLKDAAIFAGSIYIGAKAGFGKSPKIGYVK